jgi:hypothetical protein
MLFLCLIKHRTMLFLCLIKHRTMLFLCFIKHRTMKDYGVEVRPCYGSGGYSPASHRGGPG